MTESPHIYEADEQTFDELVLNAPPQLPVLVDFWAAWCNPCQVLMPLLAMLADEYAGRFRLVKVDTEVQRGLAERFGIRSLPTVQLFLRGRKVDEFLGAQPESSIRAMLDRHIPRESDAQRNRAAALLSAGDVAGALAILEQARLADPDNHRVTLDLAAALIDGGDAERAGELFAALPADQREGTAGLSFAARLLFARAAAGAPDVETLARRVRDDPADMRARWQYAARLILAGEHEPGMEQLLTLLKTDREFDDDAGRRGLLAAFELLGGEGELVHRYRALMSRSMY